MDAAKRAELTKELSRITGEIAADLQRKILADGPAQERARRLHADEKVGEDFHVWSDLLARRAAVFWVLKTVYVRVFEDRGLLRPKRIVDEESQAILFRKLAPSLGDTAYLRWVFRDLASPNGGLPELFAPQPAEVAEPSDELSAKLTRFWRATNPDTGELLFRFDQEHFDGRLMGDLYQDLDPVVKARFALLQTPDFVLDFILDETLTPAIREFGVENVRVLDPACGSGHFLIAALKRLVAGMREKFPNRPCHEVVEHCLQRVVGIDLNDYACGLARARLVMTALELCGEEELTSGADLHPRVFWADGLEQLERDAEQASLPGMCGPELRVGMTQTEVREALRPILREGFHCVVGNPPYITEKDPAKKAYHRELVEKKRRRYVSAAGKYSLGAPFTERMFQLSVEGGFVGQITANSFMKREFGKALIEQVLPRFELTKVVDTSAAYIPGHGTPTVLLFGCNRTPSASTPVPIVMGKRGEPGVPTEPRQGKVWTSIMTAHDSPGFENEFVSISSLDRSTLAMHPWSIGGGGAAELAATLNASRITIGTISDSIGFVAILGEDDAYLGPGEHFRRLSLPHVPFGIGESIRDWGFLNSDFVAFPYDLSWTPKETPAITTFLWNYRATLSQRLMFGKTQLDAGLRWFEYRHIGRDKVRIQSSIAFAEVSTHNHFVLDRGGKVFKQTAPVIKLPHDASEADHLALLAQLNSSTACFWLKQVCHNKGEGGGVRVEAGYSILGSEGWKDHYAFNGTKLSRFPLANQRHPQLEAFAGQLDALARARQENSARETVYAFARNGHTALRDALDLRRDLDLASLYRMVGLQEELDWLCYRLYGVELDAPVREVAQVPPLRPGLRAFEIALARDDAERRAALARGEEPDEAPTEWFTRHGWEPAISLDELDPSERKIVEDRLARTEANKNLALIEQATYKRRWYRPYYEAEERAALEDWLADRVEDVAKSRKGAFTAQQLAGTLQQDPAVLAVAQALTGSAAFDLESLVAQVLQADSVPANKHHVFKPTGLAKRAAWEHTWALQHREDAGEKVTPPVPPKYVGADFLKAEHWKHRGALDVPKERFVALTSVPGREGASLLYAWAGLTHRERARLYLELDEELESAGVTVSDRVGLLYDAWFLLPWVAWESSASAEEYRAVITGLMGASGVTDEALAAWAAKFAPPRSRASKPKSPKKAKASKEETNGTRLPLHDEGEES